MLIKLPNLPYTIDIPVPFTDEESEAEILIAFRKGLQQ